MVGQASSPDIMMTSGDACPTRGILYAIHRITRLNKMKIPMQLNYKHTTLMFKNKILQAYAVWFLGIFIFTLVLSVHASDEEIDSLFTPVTSTNFASDDAA